MKNYFRLALLILDYVSLSSPSLQSKARKFWNAILFVVLILTVLYYYTMLLNIYNNIDSKTAWIDTATILFATACAFCSFLSFSWKRKSIHNIVKCLNFITVKYESEFIVPNHLSSDNIEKINIFILKSLLSAQFFAVLFLSLAPTLVIFSSDRNSTINIHKPGGSSLSRLWFPFDVSSVEACIGIFFLEFIPFSFSAINFYSVCALVFCLANHIINKFKILRYQIKHFEEICVSDFENSEDDRNSNSGGEMSHVKQNYEILRAYIVKCVKYHQDILKLCSDIADAISPHLLIMTSVNVMTTCFMCFQASEMPVNSSGFLIPAFTCVLISVNLLLHSWFCSEITKQSYTVIEACYDSKWYEYSDDIKKLLLIMSIRATKTVDFRAAGIITMDMETFIRMYQAAFSYYTFLKNMTS